MDFLADPIQKTIKELLCHLHLLQGPISKYLEEKRAAAAWCWGPEEKRGNEALQVLSSRLAGNTCSRKENFHSFCLKIVCLRKSYPSPLRCRPTCPTLTLTLHHRLCYIHICKPGSNTPPKWKLLKGPDRGHKSPAQGSLRCRPNK